MATFQGDFLSPGVQRLVREFIARTGRPVEKVERGEEGEEGETMSYIDRERRASEEREGNGTSASVDVSALRVWCCFHVFELTFFCV